MNAQPQAETFEEEYEEYDEFDEDEGERGLSGLVVLLMGIVMLGAFLSVVWIAYKEGVKKGAIEASTPYIAADPDPLKIENSATAAAGNEQEVYDRLQGESVAPVETLAAGPEEPVVREADDPIAAIAAENAPGEDGEDLAADRIDALAAAAEAEDIIEPAATEPQVPAPAAPGSRPSATTAQPAASTTAAAGALSGSHLVQVGAFGSDAEAGQMWSRMQSRLGDYLDGKAPDVERADLGDKGVFYRLRVGPFATGDEAKTYCEGLKSRGQDCLVKAK